MGLLGSICNVVDYGYNAVKNNPAKTVGIVAGVAAGVATGGVGLAAMGTAVGTSTAGTAAIAGTTGALLGDSVDNRIKRS